MQVAALTQVEHRPCFTMLCVGTVSPSLLVPAAERASDVLAGSVTGARRATLPARACNHLSLLALRCPAGEPGHTEGWSRRRPGSGRFRTTGDFLPSDAPSGMVSTGDGSDEPTLHRVRHGARHYRCSAGHDLGCPIDTRNLPARRKRRQLHDTLCVGDQVHRLPPFTDTRVVPRETVAAVWIPAG